jgi:cobalt-zinc-cadmium efflux system protein
MSIRSEEAVYSQRISGKGDKPEIPLNRENINRYKRKISALFLILFAIYFLRKPPSPKRTYGFYRIEVLTSLAISAVVIIFALFILYESVSRIFIDSTSEDFSGIPLVMVAAVGMVVNIIGMVLLRKPTASKKDRSLSIAGAPPIILNDIFAATAVITTGIIIIFTNYYLPDSMISCCTYCPAEWIRP